MKKMLTLLAVATIPAMLSGCAACWPATGLVPVLPVQLVQPPGAVPAGARVLPARADVCRAAGRDGLPAAVCTDVPADGVADDAAIRDADRGLVRSCGPVQRVPGSR